MTQHLSGGPVLVVTKELDPAADLVVDELTIRRVPVMRFDMGDFPDTMALSVEHAAAPWAGVLADEYRSVRLEEVRAVYYRRPRLPAVSEEIPEPHRAWANEQALADLLGTLYALPVTWVNRPEVDGIASHKPGQLPVAAAHGLRTPRSLITTDPEAARKFCRRIDGPVICKPLMGGPLVHPDGRRTGVHTHVIDPDTIDDSVSLTAHLFQEWIAKTHEVRLAVVGTDMFAAEIHAGSSAPCSDSTQKSLRRPDPLRGPPRVTEDPGHLDRCLLDMRPTHPHTRTPPQDLTKPY